MPPAEEGENRRVWSDSLRRAVAPLTAGIMAFFASGFQWAGAGAALLVAFVVWGCEIQAARYVRQAAHLPLVRATYPLGAPLVAFAVIAFLKATSAVPGVTLSELALICLVAGVAARLSRANLPSIPFRAPGRLTRVAVIGAAGTAAELAEEMERVTSARFQLVGYMALPNTAIPHESAVPCLGTVGHVAQTVREHHLDLLLLSGQAPRIAVFDEVASDLLYLRTSVMELSAFYEDVFGHVPLGAINAAWFQFVIHPRYGVAIPASKRVVDVVVATITLLIAAPLLTVLALLIKVGGGPALYRQTRLGEGGKPFQMLKLRTMREATPDERPHWTSVNDERLTRVGWFLRRTALDELPQLVNVLRGDMTLVGPRPEQPELVERLEQTIPFYFRRHLLRPGLTGWAQVKCGYAGSDSGAIWKLCHDLYYLKHRSATLDLLILIDTLRALCTDRDNPPPIRLPRLVDHSASPSSGQSDAPSAVPATFP